MRNKHFPYFDQLSLIQGKDKAVGLNVEAPLDIDDDLDKDQNVDQVDEEYGEDDVPSITSPRDKGTSKNLSGRGGEVQMT